MPLVPALLNPLTYTPLGAWRFFTVPEKSAPQGQASKARFNSGPARIVRERIRLLDRSRPTQAYNRYPGHPARLLRGEIWRPAAMKQAGPLLVYNHGFMSSRAEAVYLLRFLASHGYTVIAVNYPLTGMFAPDKPLARDMVNQPGDISFLIDYMLARNADPDDAIHRSIDPQKIALTGLSLGSLTSMLTTFHRGLLDRRIAAAVCIAGPTSFFTPDFFAGNSVPTLLIYGDKDSVVLYEEHALPALRKIPGSILVTLKDASHTGFAQQASTMLRYLKNPDIIACRMLASEYDENAWNDLDYLSVPAGADVGIRGARGARPPAAPLIPVSMKATRQQMFTTLATHAFLDSIFATSRAARDASRRFLLKTLPGENSGELSVSR